MPRLAVIAAALAVILPTSGAFAQAPPINTPNRTHNVLAAANPPDQARVLGAAVGCRARDAVFRAYDRTSNAALWRVDCSNGQSSIVSVAADASGSTKVLSCNEFKLMARVDCF